MILDKKLAKIQSLLGKEVIGELEALTTSALDHSVAVSADAIRVAQNELEANEKYKELKESLKAISTGLKEVRAYQNAKIAYALHLIEEQGKSNE